MLPVELQDIDRLKERTAAEPPPPPPPPKKNKKEKKKEKKRKRKKKKKKKKKKIQRSTVSLRLQLYSSAGVVLKLMHAETSLAWNNWNTYTHYFDLPLSERKIP